MCSRRTILSTQTYTVTRLQLSFLPSRLHTSLWEMLVPSNLFPRAFESAVYTSGPGNLQCADWRLNTTRLGNGRRLLPMLPLRPRCWGQELMYCYCNPNEGVYSCTIYSDERLAPPSTAGAWACRLQAPRLIALLEALLCSIDCSMRSAGFCSLELAACNSAVSLAFLGGLPSLPFGESLLLTLVLELCQLSRDSGKASPGRARPPPRIGRVPAAPGITRRPLCV